MAGTVTNVYDYAKTRGGVSKVVATWVSDTAGAVSSATKLSIRGRIERIVTNPGAAGLAPTDNYDIVLNDEDGFDVASGLLANRDTANTEQIVPFISNGTVTTTELPAVAGTLDLVVSNAGSENGGTVTVYWR